MLEFLSGYWRVKSDEWESVAEYVLSHFLTCGQNGKLNDHTSGYTSLRECQQI